MGAMAIARPGKIVCVGRNYRDHAAELGNAVPAQPLLFLKPATSLIGDGEAIVLPPESSRVEHEAEIGVVIGRRIRRASEPEALAAIGGITCVNDVTARDIQRREEQWTRAKGFDTFCPAGPPDRTCRGPRASTRSVRRARGWSRWTQPPWPTSRSAVA